MSVLKLPHWRDPRYVQASIHLCYALVARFVFNFESTFFNLFAALGVCLLLDVIVSKLLYQKPNNILTSLIIAFGASIMIYSPSVWPYLGAVTCGVLSKAFIRFEGRHIYNPSNFGVTAMLALFPNWVVASGNLFSGYWVPALMFFILGSINVIWARQTVLAYSWLAAFAFCNYIRGILTDSTFSLALLALNPLILLYTFHMITDPATTPKTTLFRILFTFCVAVVDSVLRYYGNPNAQFFALFCITCFMPFVRVAEKKYMARREALAAS